MRDEQGRRLTLDVARWHARATPEEQDLLAGLDGPVIDLGCGPGRLVLSLARRRVPALGVDSSPAAVALARRRGATVLERDLFAPLPGEGRWASVLLFDGNLGIGGEPAHLLDRCRRLTGRHGSVLAEVGPPGSGLRRVSARVEREGRSGPLFPWAEVGAEAIADLAAAAGFRSVTTVRTPSGRWFARLAPTRS